MSLEIVILLILSLVCIVISFYQFKEKGILINNEYIWASKLERECMSVKYKRPHFRQSAIVFLLLGITFFALALGSFLKLNFLIFMAYLLIIINIIYSIISSVTIANNKGKL